MKDNTPTCPPSIDPINPEPPMTLAKAKAQSLTPAAAQLALTPNVLNVLSPANLAVIALQNNSVNILNVTNPATSLTVNVDAQNFGALGGKLFVLNVDSTAASTITVQFMRGNTAIKQHVLSIAANSVTHITLGALVEANNTVKFLVVGFVAQQKPEPELLLINANYNSSTNTLIYASGELLGTSAMLARLTMTANKTVAITVPSGTYSLSVALSESPDYTQALNAPTAAATLLDTSVVMTGTTGLTVAAGDTVLFGKVGNQLSLTINSGTEHLSPADSSITGDCYLYMLVTNNGVSTAPDIPMVIATSAEEM